MVSSFIVCVATLATVQGFQLQSTRSHVLPRHTSLSMKGENAFAENFQKFKKAIIPVVLGASIMLSDVHNADAARSGGRSGGSSFRGGGGGGGYRASPARSSTQLRSSSGYSQGVRPMGMPMIMPMPMYSPFGFSPFGFGFGLPSPTVIIVAGIALFLLSNRAGGSDFSNANSEDVGALGSGATVMKVQIALESDWGERSNIMNTLSRLAEKNGALSGREDIAKLLSEASLALLRKQGDWNSAAYEGELFRQGGQAAEPAFQKLAIKERAKFEEETSTIATIRPSEIGSTPTQVVVSIVVALKGKSAVTRSDPNRQPDL